MPDYQQAPVVAPTLAVSNADWPQTNQRNSLTSLMNTIIQALQRLAGAINQNIPLQGDTASRPVVTTTGYYYYDTTLLQPIYWDNTAGYWRDASGTGPV